MPYRFLLFTILILGFFSLRRTHAYPLNYVAANDSTLNKKEISLENIKKGKALYEKNCIMCHGNAGKGDGAAGLFLNPRPFDISSDKVQSQSDSTLFFKVTLGKAPMPTFKTLPFESRQLLLLYVRELGKNKTK